MDGGHNIAEQIAGTPAVNFVHDDDHRSGDLRCPHCRSTAIRRTSREVTPTFRELFYLCRNPACGHTFKASLSYDYGQWNFTGGLTYGVLGDTHNVLQTDYNDGSVWGAGLRIGYTF